MRKILGLASYLGLVACVQTGVDEGASVTAPARIAEMQKALSAADIIARATEAAGGDVWKRPQTLMLTGTMDMYKDGFANQALFVDDYRMWRKFPVASERAHKANGKVKFEAKASGKNIFTISFDGQNTYNQNGLVKENDADRRWAANFGFGIIRFTDTPGFQLARLADDQVDGHDCYFVQVTDNLGENTIFGIDKSGFEIRYVGFDTPESYHHRIYSDFYWHEDPRFRQPGRVRLYYDGVKTNDILWREVQVNAPIEDRVFVIE